MLVKVSTEYSKQCDFKQDYIANLLWTIVVGGKMHRLLQKTSCLLSIGFVVFMEMVENSENISTAN